MAKETRQVHINVSSNSAQALNKGKKAATGMAGAVTGVGVAAKKTTFSLNGMKAALMGSGIGVFLIAAGSLVSMFSKMSRLSRDFSKGLSTLEAVSGATTNEINALSSQAKQLGASTQFTAVEVVKLQVELAKLGFTVKEIGEGTPAILDLAASLEVDLASAAELAGSTVRAFGLETKDTKMVVDVMSKSTASSALNFEALRESLKLVAPTARATGRSLQETIGMLGILADNGLKGSIAGTGLAKTFIELNKKGLTLDQAMNQVAGSTNKMKTAIDLVGIIASKSFLTLANGRHDIDKLTQSMKDAEGAAREMAEIRMDNLSGDLTKLSSAWDGFVLDIEDGSGMINGTLRGITSGFTYFLGFISKGMKKTSAAWEFFKYQLSLVPNVATNVGLKIKEMAFGMVKNFNKIKLAMAGIPLLGGAIDKAKIERELKLVDEGLKALKEKYLANNREMFEKEKNFRQIEGEILYGAQIKAQKEADKKRLEEAEKVIKELTEKEKAALEKLTALRKKFFEKLSTMEENDEDKSAVEKINRKRERHLAELTTLKLNKQELADATVRLNTFYDGLVAQKRAEAKKKFLGGFKEMDPKAQIEERRAAHLLELDALELEETEKGEMLLRIKKYYDGLLNEVDTANKENTLKNLKNVAAEEERVRQEKVAAMYGVLDTAADIAGQETEIARALQAIKLAMQLAELAQKMGIIKTKLMVSAKAAVTEASIEGAKVGTATASGMAESSKVGFPWNIITMASYALQAASLIKAFSSSKGKLDGIAGGLGAGSGSGVSSPAPAAPPSFNVLGQASAGENLIANTVATTNDNPFRAYVVEGDISSRQSLARNATQMASMG